MGEEVVGEMGRGGQSRALRVKSWVSLEANPEARGEGNVEATTADATCWQGGL